MEYKTSLSILILILISPLAWGDGILRIRAAEPVEFASPEPTEVVAPAPAPELAPVVETPPAEAAPARIGFCGPSGCIKLGDNGQLVAPTPLVRPNFPKGPRTGPPTVRELCYGQFMLDAAKKSTKYFYNNRDYFAGFCAEGVNNHLVWAGVKRPGQIESPISGTGYLDAYEYHYRGTLKAMGFRDIFYPGM